MTKKKASSYNIAVCDILQQKINRHHVLWDSAESETPSLTKDKMKLTVWGKTCSIHNLLYAPVVTNSTGIIHFQLTVKITTK